MRQDSAGCLGVLGGIDARYQCAFFAARSLAIREMWLLGLPQRLFGPTREAPYWEGNDM